MTAVAGVFVASIFSSAFLLFLVQPLVTRMLLPAYGGSPAVWNTALVFFQTTLLCGYLYAHLLITRIPQRLRPALHGLVLLAPLLLLPPDVPAFLSDAASVAARPLTTLLGALAMMVGAPFLALSTNSSLVQYWWSQSDLPGRQDPYWLYGASNAGSLIALLSYPFVVEPLLGVSRQADVFAWGYGLFVVFTSFAMLRARRHDSPSESKAPDPHPTFDTGAVSSGRAILWVIRAAVGSSLLLSVTMQITTDLAPAPLFWVVPLALYLATFIIAFTWTERVPRRLLAAGTVVALSAELGVLLTPGRMPFEALLSISLVTLFFGAQLCHHDLASDRPPPHALTAFYLWISVVCVLGGFLNSIVAPLIFDSVAELPLTLMALALLVYVRPAAERSSFGYRPPWWAAAAAAVGILIPVFLALSLAEPPGAQELGAMAAFGLVWTIAFARYVGAFAICVWMGCGLTLAGIVSRPNTIEMARSFFGVVQIREQDGGIDMVHGNTVHGRQLLDPERRLTPISYYYPEGPIGSLALAVPRQGRMGVVGLGTGALAILARPNHEVVYYEIDPLVERLARQHFTFLEESSAAVEVVIGDGRLALQATADRSFDLLLIDAFSSDFVPVHLLTAEATDTYLGKVRPNGVLAFHLSNRYVDLRRVVQGYAGARGIPVLFADYTPPSEAVKGGAVRTVVAVLSPDPTVIDRLAERPLWSHFSIAVPGVYWTDDHADLLSVLR